MDQTTFKTPLKRDMNQPSNIANHVKPRPREPLMRGRGKCDRSGPRPTAGSQKGSAGSTKTAGNVGKLRRFTMCLDDISHRIHVWYIYLHLVDFYGKCREIYHTWILWVWYMDVSLNGGTPISHPKSWSFLVGKPMVVGYHHFRKHPYDVVLTIQYKDI